MNLIFRAYQNWQKETKELEEIKKLPDNENEDEKEIIEMTMQQEGNYIFYQI